MKLVYIILNTSTGKSIPANSKLRVTHIAVILCNSIQNKKDAKGDLILSYLCGLTLSCTREIKLTLLLTCMRELKYSGELLMKCLMHRRCES